LNTDPHFQAGLQRFRQWWLIGISILLLAGCGVKFFYNRLDWLIPWYLDDYIAFTGKQQLLLERHLGLQLDWHRATQLPDYVVWLRQMRADLAVGLDADKLDKHYELMQDYWRRLMSRLVPTAASLLATLSDAQLEEFYARLEQDNREYYENYIAVLETQARKRRVKRVRKHLQRWLGQLNPAQEQALAEWGRQLALIGRESLRYRQQWLRQLQQVLTQRDDVERLNAALQDLLLFADDDLPPAYRQQLEYNVALTKKLILLVDRTMTTDQRQHFMDRLAALAGDFEQLADAKAQ